MTGPLESFDIQAAGATNRGPYRDLNEDSLLAEFPVYLVADGMGGHSAGERASQAVVDEFASLIGRTDISAGAVRECIATAQRSVTDIGGGAGSTLSGVVAVQESQGRWTWIVMNLGDSRVYRCVGGRIQALSQDHSEVAELLRAGILDSEQARHHPHKNVITKAVGDGESDADYWITPIVPGDTVLICSDGLHGVLDEGTLYRWLASDSSADTIAAGLVNEAIAEGSRDNVTAVVIRVDGRSAGGASSSLPGIMPIEWRK